jgi:hypothetical protein
MGLDRIDPAAVRSGRAISARRYPQLFVIEENLELEVAVSFASLTKKVDAPGRTWTCIAGVGPVAVRLFEDS